MTVTPEMLRQMADDIDAGLDRNVVMAYFQARMNNETRERMQGQMERLERLVNPHNIPNDAALDNMSRREMCNILRGLYENTDLTWVYISRRIGVTPNTIRVWALGEDAGARYPFLPQQHHRMRIKTFLRGLRDDWEGRWD